MRWLRFARLEDQTDLLQTTSHVFIFVFVFAHLIFVKTITSAGCEEKIHPGVKFSNWNAKDCFDIASKKCLQVLQKVCCLTHIVYF